ncbi:uncharacterized protein [Hetaerina americana]|uniref:uncharacterized protein n=1 Tax=Hetaerina americana TaxID=62018 RepID=UPI003A7F3FC5
MIGNCTWNLNSSILVNSVAERQAQKRKIRNGQLPMPKLIKTALSSDMFSLHKSSNIACPSTSDSLLPDTVIISEDIIKSENIQGSSKNCCNISCGVSENASSSSVDRVVSSPTVSDTYERSAFELIDSLKNSPGIVKNTVDVSGHKVSHDTMMLSNGVCRRDFIDLSNSSLLKKTCIEKGDGLVLKLGCSDNDSPRILTVVQENKITFWESPSTSLQQLSWSKTASIPISASLIRGQGSLNSVNAIEIILEMGLHPSIWTSVVLMVDPNASKCSVYGYGAHGATKTIDNLPKSPLAYQNQKKLYSCLLDSSTIVIWHHNEGKGTTLKKYLLSDDLDDLLEVNEWLDIENNIQSVHIVHAAKPVVVGISEKLHLIMWNHITGNVIKSLDLFSSEIHSYIGIIEDKGFLFVIANGKLGSAHLLAVNIDTKKWMVLKTYKSSFKGCISGYAIDDGLLLAAYEDGIVVWDMATAIELSCFLPQRKCVPYVFSEDIVFVTNECDLYILNKSLIFKMQRGNHRSEKLQLNCV